MFAGAAVEHGYLHDTCWQILSSRLSNHAALSHSASSSRCLSAIRQHGATLNGLLLKLTIGTTFLATKSFIIAGDWKLTGLAISLSGSRINEPVLDSVRMRPRHRQGYDPKAISMMMVQLAGLL